MATPSPVSYTHLLGRDFEERGGKYYFYRQFDPLDMFMTDWTPQQTHNLSVSGGSDKPPYNIRLGYFCLLYTSPRGLCPANRCN